MRNLPAVSIPLSLVFIIFVSCAVASTSEDQDDGQEVPNISDNLQNLPNLIPDTKIPIIDDLIKNNGMTWNIYNDGKRMMEILNFTTPIGILRGEYCYVYGDMFIIDQILKLVPLKTDVTPEEMDELIDKCEQIQQKNMLKGSIIPQVILDLPGGIFRRLGIFPGTRWCGAGDIARQYEHLGPAKGTDKCCRTHDHCPDNMLAGKKKNGLVNNGFYTKSHCNCDKTFYNCLKKDGSTTSMAVGVMFFNILRTECFDQEHPLKCVRKFPPFFGKCIKYELDKRKPKKWQFIVPKSFEVSGDNKDIEKIFKEAF